MPSPAASRTQELINSVEEDGNFKKVLKKNFLPLRLTMAPKLRALLLNEFDLLNQRLCLSSLALLICL